MKRIFPVVIGLLCCTLPLTEHSLAQAPDAAHEARDEAQSTLYIHVRPRIVVEWPAIADTRRLLENEQHRATLGIPEILWASLPNMDSLVAETAFDEVSGTTLRVTLTGADPAVVIQPLVAQMVSTAAVDVRHRLLTNPNGSQTLWLWNSGQESPRAITPFDGFDRCPALGTDPDVALLLCARLTAPEAAQGIVWIEVRLNDAVSVTLGLGLDRPADVAESERQLGLLLSADNEAGNAALAFLGLQSIRERAVIQAQDDLVTMEVQLNPDETSRLTRLLYETLASEVR
jgi:hypothetical protein